MQVIAVIKTETCSYRGNGFGSMAAIFTRNIYIVPLSMPLRFVTRTVNVIVIGLIMGYYVITVMLKIIYPRYMLMQMSF